MKLSKEQVMVAKGMAERGTSVRRLPCQLGVRESVLRYRPDRIHGFDARDHHPRAGHHEVQSHRHPVRRMLSYGTPRNLSAQPATVDVSSGSRG